MKRLLSIFFSMCLMASVALAATIYLKSGEQAKGTIVEAERSENQQLNN